MNGKRLTNAIVRECERMGVDGVTVLDVTGRTPFFDFLVLATVDNTVLADALLRNVHTKVRLDPGVAAFTESSPASDWVVCDFGDVLFHVFVGEEVRRRYDLEGLWQEPRKRRSRTRSEAEESETPDV